MIRITIKNRSTKTAGLIRLRFRLKDGKTDITHKTDITADVYQLSKFDTLTCKPRRGVSIFDYELADAIDKEVADMGECYAGMKKAGRKVTGETFAAAFADMIAERETHSRRDGHTFISDFGTYAQTAESDGTISRRRGDHYRSTLRLVTDYLTGRGLAEIAAADFTPEMLADFRRWLLSDSSRRHSQNTAAAKLKMLHTFFAAEVTAGQIDRSPFDGLTKSRREGLTREKYTAPVYLTAKEFAQILTADIPADLTECRETFCVHAAIGARVSDYARMSRKCVSVSADGIPFVHYVPQKTKRINDRDEIETPLLRFAFDIITRRGFSFPLLRNISGKDGYNAQIKRLLQAVGIDRPVQHYNAETQQIERVPLYQVGSTKLARKTFVDMMAKVQINIYASGLHAYGSEAAEHYTRLELADRFRLMCIAFDQKPYKTDNKLNVIEK